MVPQPPDDPASRGEVRRTRGTVVSMRRVSETHSAPLVSSCAHAETAEGVSSLPMVLTAWVFFERTWAGLWANAHAVWYEPLRIRPLPAICSTGGARGRPARKKDGCIWELRENIFLAGRHVGKKGRHVAKKVGVVAAPTPTFFLAGRPVEKKGRPFFVKKGVNPGITRHESAPAKPEVALSGHLLPGGRRPKILSPRERP